MAMNPVQLTVVRRPTGKAAVKQLRRQGLVPGIFYGPGVDPYPDRCAPSSAATTGAYTGDSPGATAH
jgi:ribosomal protein L25 (general stress protein Ctc)